MRILICSLALLGGLAVVPAFLADEGGAGKADPARIEKLIKDLGSERFAERTRAQKELKLIGEPALEELRKAAKSDDAEASRIAGELVKSIESQKETAGALTPKRVHLKVKDVSVIEALAELSRQSGYKIQVQGDVSELVKRKVTLTTGEVTFWEAFDQVCEKGAMVEGQQGFGGGPYYYGPTPVPAMPVLPAQPPVPLPKVAPPAPAAPPAQLKKAQAAAAVARVQVAQAAAAQGQAAPGVVVQAQPAIAIGRAIRPFQPMGAELVVHPGTPQKLPTCYAGSVRIRAVPGPAIHTGAERETSVWLEVTAEPRLQPISVAGSPRLKKAVDDLGQTLTLLEQPQAGGGFGGPGVAWSVPMMPGFGGGNRQQVLVRLKQGEKDAKSLKELSGSLTLQTLSALEPVLKLENVLKAVGKTAKGEHAGTLELLDITKEEGGDYRVKVKTEQVPGVNFGVGAVGVGVAQPAIQIGGGGAARAQTVGPAGAGTPTLVDKAGKAFDLVGQPTMQFSNNNGKVSMEMTLVFRPKAGQGEPASLVVYGHRPVNVPVNFRLENVTLPPAAAPGGPQTLPARFSN
jgi:hypothetical protein